MKIDLDKALSYYEKQIIYHLQAYTDCYKKLKIVEEIISEFDSIKKQ